MRDRKALALVVGIILGMAVVPDGWGGGRAAPASGTSGTDRSNFNTLGTYPIVKQKETITVVVGDGSSTFNGDTNWMTKFYEDKTNVHVNWIVAPLEQFKERVNLALASADPIDVVIAANSAYTAYTMVEQSKFAEQKVILPLNEYIENDTVNLKQRLGEVELWREVLTLPNGNIYALPTLNDCYHCRYYGKMWVNKEFLKNLNLQVPGTPEEFRRMLLAFKNRDANGNGDPNDEIPMMGAIDNFGARIDTFLVSAFVYDDGGDRLYLENGKVTAAFTRPEFQEGLRYLHGLFSEGLIAKDSFTASRQVRHQLNSGKYESVIGAIPNIHHGNLGNREDYKTTGQPVRWLDYEPIPPLKGPKGLQVTRYDYYQKFMTSESAGFLPATCRNPALVMRWLDWFYTDEGNIILRNGEKGMGWTDADPGATGPGGLPAKIKSLTLDPSHPYYGNASWGARFPNFSTYEFRNLSQTAADMLAPDGSGLERFLEVKSRDNYAPYAQDIHKLLPPMYYSGNCQFSPC
ncbi:MAG: extracellular solute-binding protein [Treponema sp.]|jgi:putative aldouronate transport system substrate-binding protein|nr:extracellular solute-binding protein [Treponema sp.]